VLRGVLVVPAQIVGAIASAAVVRYLFPGPLAVTTSLNQATGITTSQGLFIEMFATAQLVFTIYMLAVEKHRATFLAPLGIGLSLFTAELAAVYYTGGSLNPARSLAPALINDLNFTSDHWIYWLGPLMGAVVASGLYLLLKACRYQGANPGQDDSTDEADRQLINMLKERLGRKEERPRLALRHMDESPRPTNVDSWGTVRG
jgi:aquaporin rerated protein, other eukaryote